MRHQQPDSYWRELTEASDRAQQAQLHYRATRDALFVNYGRESNDQSDELWHDYCECVEQLKKVIAELGDTANPTARTG